MARKRHEEHEEHENHERWLVTYADMITLLMVLFIVLFAMSTVDQKKFNALKAGLAAGFGQSTSILDGSTSILSEPGTAVAAPINPNKIEDAPEIKEIKTAAVTAAQRAENQRQYGAAAAEADRLLTVEKKLKGALAAKGLASDVTTRIDGRGLTVSLVSRHIVFAANLATLSPRGVQILDVLAPVLLEIDDRLQIEGHTNQAKGKPKFYASDWDLAAARAVTVLRYLNESKGVPASRLAAVGFGHIKPLVDPSKPGSQALNKRVDIVVLSTLANENAEVLDAVAEERAEARRRAAAERRAAATAPTKAAPTSTTHPTTNTEASSGGDAHGEEH